MEIALQSLLRQICENSYPSVAPHGTAPPFIAWQQVGGREVTTLAKKRVKRNALVQIAVWAPTPDAAGALLDQVDSGLRASTSLQASPSGARRMLHEPDTGLHGNMQDWSIWS